MTSAEFMKYSRSMTPNRGETVYVLRHFARLSEGDLWQPLNNADYAALRAMVEGMPALFANTAFADFYVAVGMEDMWPGESYLAEPPPNALVHPLDVEKIPPNTAV